MIFSFILFFYTPCEAIIQNFVEDVRSIYEYQMRGGIPARLLAGVLLQKEKVKECLPEGFTFEESGFPWERGHSFFIAPWAETGEKTTVLITGERVRFKYRIYDEIILPHFVNYNRNDGIVVKAWIDTTGKIHVVREYYYRKAGKIWEDEFESPLEREFLLAEYGDKLKELKKNKVNESFFKAFFFEKETSGMHLPEEAHHLRFRGPCELDEEILARLNRLWFNPTYTFVYEIIKSASPVPGKMGMEWVLEKNLPHKTSSRFILYSMDRFFRPSSISALSKIPREEYAYFAERTYFSLLGSPSFCDRPWIQR